MDPSELLSRSRSFEQGATAYEEYRPEFPDELFEMLSTVSGNRLSQRVLEIGAGTGKATLPLVVRGALVDVVEPSAEMVGVLRQRLEATGLSDRVHLRAERFEDVDPSENYDVVVAAQSFHWADPVSRWSRLASLLRPDGRAFLFWNGWALNPAELDLAAVAAAYDRWAPALDPDIEDHRGKVGWAEQEVAAVADLELERVERFSWPWHLTTEDYLSLLATTSQYAVAPPTVRNGLFDALREVLGERVLLDGRTLFLVVVPVLPR
ncbi:trans-aconitate 2-methyltransferase [Branchiibius sp. NY16-3462-2]|uniref:class I SAM-dependent methyltransferase n=1 Tax=Branchiibius sp. NY16-3462-2 TaxID=1807500 RepID=UPI0007996F72|nr:class I SAM-dependent methyltransferase [Branchiibius sp. NY16-3462-2]KYH43740.1 hypothetical protein AZH51_02790 [Branchiibius sp. NY16-3462-2]